MRALPFVLLVTTGSAFAQPTDQPPSAKPAPKPSDDRALTIMWAPIRLVIPLVEFTGEYRVADKVGVSLQLGGGRRTLTQSMTDIKGTEYEVGAQGRYYLLGSFTHGMELGAELLEEYVKLDEPLPANIVAAAAGGLTAGAFAGYKIATHFGFTFEGQVGARYLVMEPAVTGMGKPMLDSRWAPILHLNIGWTF